jgi:hypothetical protein
MSGRLCAQRGRTNIIGLRCAAMAKSWLCRLRWHRWVKRVNDSGEAYIVCARCNRDGDMPQRSLMAP